MHNILYPIISSQNLLYFTPSPIKPWTQESNWGFATSLKKINVNKELDFSQMDRLGQY